MWKHRPLGFIRRAFAYLPDGAYLNANFPTQPSLRHLAITSLASMSCLSVYSVLALTAEPATEQKSPSVIVVPLGQLDGPRLRQMPRQTCGPYFTFAPTDRRGGGTVYFGFRRLDTVADADQLNAVEVGGFANGSIRPRICPTCTAPIADRETRGTSEWITLSISAQDLQLSPCLKK